MTPEYTKYEADGWFYLSTEGGGFARYDGSLGTGSARSITRFQSDESRAYFIQARQYEYAANIAACDLECLRSELRKAVKKRGVRKRILELIGAAL